MVNFKKLAAFWFFSVLFHQSASGASLEPPPLKSGNIKIMVENCDPGKGKIMIALHNTKKTFLKKVAPFQRAIVPNSASMVEYTFEKVPYGEYAVAVFQDDNENMDLDLGKMFIPKEKYGFSNNIRGKYGPPSYNKVKFELEKPGLEMKIAISTP